MRVAGRGYRDGVRSLEVMLESEWWEKAGETRSGESYGAEIFLFK